MSAEERRLKRIKRDLLLIAEYALRQHKKYYREFFVGRGENVRVGEQEKTAIFMSEKERIKFHMREYELAISLYAMLTDKTGQSGSDLKVITNFPLD